MGKKVLVLDDKPSIGQLVSIYLSPEWDTVWFDNPLKGITWLEAGNRPDLIISDMLMPGMRGDEFLEYIRGSKDFGTISVIMLSGEECSEQRQRLLRDGADDYIIKPFAPTELRHRIGKVLR